ncbi:MAG: DUF3189 family protein [Firmicutes bacterium]|nr:DUF3189 family protein [Bacillota bacterium]
MVIIYCCYGGSHSSPVAAAIHIGQLARSKIPTKAELLSVPYYDQGDSLERGIVKPMGVDEYGNQVYICGRGSERRAIEQAVLSGIRLAGGNVEQVLFVNTLTAVNFWMRIGGFLSRKLKLVSLGRPLVVIGTLRAFPQLVKIVEQTKSSLTNG